jgi:hypothetical protein
LKSMVWLFWRVVLGEGAQRAKCHAHYFMHGKVVDWPRVVICSDYLISLIFIKKSN